MSKVSNAIFHNEEHYLSSPFGERASIKTEKGNTATFHSGADYATNGKKLKQYAVENGTVLSCGTDSAYANAKYVWVSYPRLGVKMLHYHLDSIGVKKGQSVNEKTVLGRTGKTGLATGVHLHLGIKRLSGGGWLDPESWSENEYAAPKKTSRHRVGDYIVTRAQLLYVRRAPGKSGEKLSFSELSKDAQKKILRLSGYRANGYVNGLCFSVLEVRGNWGRTPSGWVCLDYCEAI